jgi:hypothetical protein
MNSSKKRPSFQKRNRVDYFIATIASRTTNNKELAHMAIKTGNSGETKPKRSSKGKRRHVQRLKQEARKTAGTTHA